MLQSPHRVGIVMLMYNKAGVVIQALQSLARAKTNVPFELYLLDNGSAADESATARASFDQLARDWNLQGKFVRSEVNHGFPRGNNLGIREFLERDEITHICLLNSDVVLTDGWLDRLLEKNADAIGPVTNACGNEQTIAIERYPEPTEDVYALANAWARERHATFRGFWRETQFLGFFCFLARVELFLMVGFLDERFGRGGYEDDDYCVRMLQAGYHLAIARDVFVFHWGTQSFKQIPLKKLLKDLEKNKALFEAKYDAPWKDRSLLPLQGAWDDAQFLAAQSSQENSSQALFLGRQNLAYTRQLLQQAAPPVKPAPWIVRAWRALTRPLANMWRHRQSAARFEFWRAFRKRKSILIVGRCYPTEEFLNDGYHQRVRLIDRQLEDFCRVYVRFEPQKGWLPEIRKIKPRAYEILIDQKRFMHRLCGTFLARLAGRIYCHSVLVFEQALTRKLFLASKTRIFDVHGVVPEEFLYSNDPDSSKRFGDIERFAYSHASLVVVVTFAMRDHLVSKYTDLKPPTFACLSMLPGSGVWNADGQSGPRDGIIYCGGTQKWQQLDKMLELVHRDGAAHHFTFLVPDPAVVQARYRELFNADFPATLTSAPPDRVGEYYRTHACGLVLRENIVVNTVACPTKLVEYLQYGLVPVVDSPNIGDFLRYGYQYVPVDQALPSGAAAAFMAGINRSVLRKLYFRFISDLETLHEILK